MKTKKPTQTPAPMLNIGPSKGSIEAAQEAILSFMYCDTAEEQTKREAIRALKDLCSVSHVTITSCNFQTGE